jgi:hypothetical protein
MQLLLIFAPKNVKTSARAIREFLNDIQALDAAAGQEQTYGYSLFYGTRTSIHNICPDGMHLVPPLHRNIYISSATSL